MAMRSTASSVTRSSLDRLMGGGAWGSGAAVFPRYFSSDGKKILSEEERAAENVYIQKMERERMEKRKQRMEKEKAEGLKDTANTKSEGETQRG